ncbi:MAG: hypothetical protein L6290_12235 [Thermodesulfovibrionales bacterium]|nr:hypothetical protein [Thermodesulfovibrionales bacterium]
MYISRIHIRKFIDAVEWSTVRNIIILANGRYTSRGSAVIRNELEKMTRTKRVPPLRKLHNQGMHAVYGSPYTKKKDVGNHHFLHDNQLRDCLARYLYDRNLQGIEELSVKKIRENPDAHLGNIYFEFDNGHMNDDQLIAKIRRHYAGQGAFRVIFFMRHRYDDPAGEQARLAKLFEIVKRILSDKPNRILGATYIGFLENGKIFNSKWTGIQI